LSGREWLPASATLVLGSTALGLTDALLPIAAGTFLYIAGSDLIPELRNERRLGPSLRQFGLVLGGILVMALLLWLE